MKMCMGYLQFVFKHFNIYSTCIHIQIPVICSATVAIVSSVGSLQLLHCMTTTVEKLLCYHSSLSPLLQLTLQQQYCQNYIAGQRNLYVYAWTGEEIHKYTAKLLFHQSPTRHSDWIVMCMIRNWKDFFYLFRAIT